MRLPIASDEKLAVTLRFLATGESYESRQYQFWIHRTAIGRFVPLMAKPYTAVSKKNISKCRELSKNGNP